MSELLEENEVEENFRIKLHVQMRLNRPRHDAVRALQVAFWFNQVMTALEVKSAGAVERWLIQDHRMVSGAGEEEWMHGRKWFDYQCGRHKPTEKIVDLVESSVSGSKACLNHPFWDVVRGNKRVINLWKSALLVLDPEIIEAASPPWKRNAGENKIPDQIGSDRLRMLERRPGLDSLACLIILLRSAAQRKNVKQLHDIGDSIYRVLLMCSVLEFFCAWRNELYDILFRYVFQPFLKIEKIDFKENFDLFHALVQNRIASNKYHRRKVKMQIVLYQQARFLKLPNSYVEPPKKESIA